jgi:hypothetical protein
MSIGKKESKTEKAIYLFIRIKTVSKNNDKREACIAPVLSQ